jgi:hypothetical protein
MKMVPINKRPFIGSIVLGLVGILSASSAAAYLPPFERVIEGKMNGMLLYSYKDGKNYACPAFGDLDGDGDLDLLLGGRKYDSGKLEWFENVGDCSSASWVKMVSDDSRPDSLLIEDGYAYPTLVDIDADGDLDLFIGSGEMYPQHRLYYFRNDGTPVEPEFILVSANYLYFTDDGKTAPVFVDIDADGDQDLFVGDNYGEINFYRNDGDSTSPSWTYVTEDYEAIHVGWRSKPEFCDIDGDSDFDLFIGCGAGRIRFYRNDGTADSATWTYVSNDYVSIPEGGSLEVTPRFADIDSDGDFDLFVGEEDGRVEFAENIGCATSADWQWNTQSYISIESRYEGSPALADVDGDGDLDMVLGNGWGKISFLENVGDSADADWEFVTRYYAGVDLGDDIIAVRPDLVDIDNDGDLDLFFSERAENHLMHYRNDGTSEVPVWTLASAHYDSINVAWGVSFADIDADGDYDMFIARGNQLIQFYRNIGSPDSAEFYSTQIGYAGVSDAHCAPSFGDTDFDADLDFYYCAELGNVRYVENIGGPDSAAWAAPMGIDMVHVGHCGATELADIDGDGDLDIFAGDQEGGVLLFENLRDPTFAGSPVREIAGESRNRFIRVHPNPFNPAASISYAAGDDDRVEVSVFDLQGRHVRTLFRGEQQLGRHEVVWDGRNDVGEDMASGVYFVVLSNRGGRVASAKMVLLR